MAGLILALNSGSSSLKFGVYRAGLQDEEQVLSGSADGIGRDTGSLHITSADGKPLLERKHLAESQEQAVAAIRDALQEHVSEPFAAVGHRIVHGGPHVREHRLITPTLIAELKQAADFAPLHIPQALSIIHHSEKFFPGAPQFACLDTAFHRTLPDSARILPVPRALADEGVFRYGFHGLSYESIVHRLKPDVPHRAVFAHLGSGCSLCAVLDGESVDTSMGLTPTGGIPMSTRSGDLDPGVLLFLMRNKKLDADALEDMLNRHSGLEGLSGGESDMQKLLTRSQSGEASAALAVDAFVIAVQKTIAGYAARLGGIDLLVFTGGIGEHSVDIRSRVLRNLQFAGITEAMTRVLPAEEEKQIARHCRRLLG